MPSGMPTITAAASEPSASVMCLEPSARKLSATVGIFLEDRQAVPLPGDQQQADGERSYDEHADAGQGDRFSLVSTSAAAA
jgi:hypothetical protein